MQIGNARSGVMRATIDAFDWASTPLGTPVTWPETTRTLVDLALDTPFPMTVMLGPELYQIYNDAMLPIFRGKHPAGFGRPAHETWAEAWPAIGHVLEAVYTDGVPAFFENLPIAMRRDGKDETGYFTFSYTPLRDGRGIAGVICILNETTSQVLREREKDDAAAALAAVDRAKTAFFNDVSHEFRTPLTLMLGPLEELARTLPDFEQRHLADLARRNALRLRKHVNALLDYSLVQSGTIVPHFESVHLGALTAGLASEFRSSFARAGLTLEVRAASGPSVAVDRGMYEKILLNLLSNALKFTFEGGVTVSNAWDAEHAIVTVADTGVGIAAGDLGRLFQRFERVRSSRSRSQEGTGLGLAVTRELVELHGGTIDVTSTPDVGSTFTIRFPLLVALESSSDSPVATLAAVDDTRRDFVDEAGLMVDRVVVEPVNAPPGAPHVLVADDDDDLRAYLASLLSPRYRVSLARDGFELIDSARSDRPDLIVADVLMPRLDGYEALRRLRADSDLASVPFLLLSARANPEAATRGLGAGADDYIVKPFAAVDLLARIAALLRRATTRPQVGTDPIAARATELLADVSDRLLAASDVPAVWDAVTAATTPIFADWSAVNVPDGAGLMHTTSIRHRELAKARLGEALSKEYPNRIGDGTIAASVFTTMTPVFLERIDQAIIEQSAYDEKHAAILRALDLRSAIIVPIVVRDVVVASITVVRSENSTPFGESDVDLLERVAARVGVSYESASAHQRARTIALTLQQAMLPAALPNVPGLRLDASYSPAAQESLVGGDWYDAFALENGSVVISIGDVVGHGLSAATTMASLRTTVRGLAADQRDPAAMLGALNRILLVDHPGALATALIAIVDSQGLEGVFASAGHYGAIRVARNGTTGVVGGGGLMLGADADAAYETDDVLLEPGDLLGFFTDGYIENDRNVIAGERALVDALVRAHAASEPAAAVHLAIFGAQAPRDDAALLTLFVEPTLARLAMRRAALPKNAAPLRRALKRFLEGAPLDDERRFELLTAAGEAVINAIEHAYGDGTGNIMLLGSVIDGDVVIDVEDYGGWLGDREPTQQRGYGLPLIHAFVDSVEIDRRATGTTVKLKALARRGELALPAG